MVKRLSNPSFQYWNSFLRQRFSRLSSREKVLLILLLFGLVGFWATFLIDRAGSVKTSIAAAHVDAKVQRITIDAKDAIQANFDEKISQINLSELPTRNEAVASLDSLVKRYGLEYSIGPAKTEALSPLSFHTFSLDLRKADYNKLISFTRELKTSLPYVGTRQITIRAPSRSPNELDVKLQFTSIEYTP